MEFFYTVPGPRRFMHKVLGIITVVLLSAAVALAEGRPPGKGPQDKDDHDDRAPVQSGYAVVTPSTTSGTGLVVFETFGWRRGGDAGTTQAGVLAPGFTTNAVLFVDSKGKLSKNLGLAMVNPGPLPTIATGVGGTGAALLPEFVTGGGWATELVLMNTGTGIITVRVDLFNSSCNPLSATLNGHNASSFTDLNIPPGGVLILAPRDSDGADDF